MKTNNNNKRNFLRRSSLVAIVAVAFFAASCENEEMPTPQTNGQELASIPATLDMMSENSDMLSQSDNLKAGKGEAQRYNSKFKTLRALLDYTNLTETVSENRLTVLAPTDAAFASFFSALGIQSMYDVSPEFVTSILAYHVIEGLNYSSGLVSGSVKTFGGEMVDVNVNGSVKFNDATVEMPDIKAMNGVIHAIDQVLLPPSITGSIFGIAFTTSGFEILAQAIIKAGLVETLATPGPYTVFAPTNSAFVDLLDELGPDYNSLDDIVTKLPGVLPQVLLYHAVVGKVYSSDLPNGPLTVGTVQGADITIDKSILQITDAVGRDSDMDGGSLDIDATNGVIHVIERVLLPILP